MKAPANRDNRILVETREELEFFRLAIHSHSWSYSCSSILYVRSYSSFSKVAADFCAKEEDRSSNRTRKKWRKQVGEVLQVEAYCWCEVGEPRNLAEQLISIQGFEALKEKHEEKLTYSRTLEGPMKYLRVLSRVN